METILPHRPPMIWLDRVDDDADKFIQCSVTLRPDFPLVENGVVPAVVATELMAQCVAAYAGLRAQRRGDSIRVGYLIGARRVDLAVDSLDLNEELVISAHHHWGDDILGRFDTSVVCNDREVASAVLTVYQGAIER